VQATPRPEYPCTADCSLTRPVRRRRISQSPAVTRSSRFNVEAATSQQCSGAAIPSRCGGNCLTRITVTSRRRTGRGWVLAKTIGTSGPTSTPSSCNPVTPVAIVLGGNESMAPRTRRRWESGVAAATYTPLAIRRKREPCSVFNDTPRAYASTVRKGWPLRAVGIAVAYGDTLRPPLGRKARQNPICG
jgi:hypothetical protein